MMMFRRKHVQQLLIGDSIEHHKRIAKGINFLASRPPMFAAVAPINLMPSLQDLIQYLLAPSTPMGFVLIARHQSYLGLNYGYRTFKHCAPFFQLLTHDIPPEHLSFS